MSHITKEELYKILRKHKLWLEGKDGGERATLFEANLCGANLSGADLSGANLFGANLSRANLNGTFLRRANLSRADLYGANLSEANLYGANLDEANLRSANLKEANLSGTFLRRADLRRADLRRADLSGANLRGADFCEATMEGVAISPSTAFFRLQCPEEGSFIGWKKAVCNYNFVIVKLLITEDALRSSATTRKCRASKAKVLDIQDLDGNSMGACSAYSYYDEDFTYKIGEVVEVSDFDPDRWKECSAGIHFFITRQEAVDYNL